MDFLPKDIWCPFCHKEETCCQVDKDVYFCSSSELTFSIDDSDEDKRQTQSN